MKKSYILASISTLIMLAESKKKIDINNELCNTILENVGWKELNDVNSVVFLQKSYSLKYQREDVIKMDCNKRVRVLTLTLACSYLIDLKTLFFIFVEFGKHCKNFISNNNPKTGYKCAIKLLNILQKMPSLATLMKETLYVLDYLHTSSWTNTIIFENLFINLEQFKKISNGYIPKKNDSTTTERFIEFLEKFLHYRNIDTTYDCCIHCKFEPFHTESFWNTLNEEYQGKTLQYFDYLSESINLKINSIIINKFHRLGFRHDRRTLQIGIPLPSQYKTNDIKFFTRPNNISEANPREQHNREMENRWIIKLIDSFGEDLVNESNTNEEVHPTDLLGQELLNESNTNEGVQLTDFLGKELVNESNTNEKVQLIDFLGQELVNESNTNEEVQLIDFLGKELVNESNSNEEVQLIDFLGQGLKPNDSYDDNLDPMEIDENRENYIKFF